MDVAGDTFGYIMNLIECSEHPLYICGYNSARFDLYFIVNRLISSEYAEKYSTRTIFKGGALVYLALMTDTPRLISHDLCQITGCSLDNACKSYLRKSVKGIFPHLYANRNFFKDASILDKCVNLTPEDYPYGHRLKLTENDLINFNFGEELNKYGKNDTEILMELYLTMNRDIYHKIAHADILNFITLGMTSNYLFMKNLPKACIKETLTDCYKCTKEIRSRLYLCDSGENELCRNSIYGGKSLPRILSYRSKDYGKKYTDIQDYYFYLDISGMYVNVMRENRFPYDLAEYMTKAELNDINNGVVKKLPEFYIADVSVSPNINDIEPCLGRKENGKLIWDNTPRRGCYNSIDIQLLLDSGGKIDCFHRMLYWSKSELIFKDWMDTTLKLKTDGDELNAKEDGSGDALRAFGKALGNSTYGQTLKNDYDDVIRMIGSPSERDIFMANYELKNIILNEDNPDGFHTFIGNKKFNEQKLTSRSVFLGSFVLSYSRKLFYNIINDLYGEDRYTKAGLENQILYGDTDSLLVHSSRIPRIEKWLGKDNGQLSDDFKGEIGAYTKIIEYMGYAPKLNGMKYVRAGSDVIQEKMKIKGISQDNNRLMINNEEKDLSFNNIKEIYLSKLENSIVMDGKMKKINVKLNSTEKRENKKPFSIHNTQIERALFKSEWKGRKLVGNIFIPIGSSYIQN
jgi:hypothetical protein